MWGEFQITINIMIFVSYHVLYLRLSLSLSCISSYMKFCLIYTKLNLELSFPVEKLIFS